MIRIIERLIAGSFAAAAIFMVVVTAGAGIRSWIVLQPIPPLQVGSPAPTLTLPVAGEPDLVVDTSRLLGRPYLIARWDEHCGDCAGSLRLANSYHEEFAHTGFVALVVNDGSYLSAFRSRDVGRQLAPSALRLEDAQRLMQLRFRSEPAPLWVLIGSSGKVVGFGSSVGPSRDMIVAAASL
jgi:hypothetical protein